MKTNFPYCFFMCSAESLLFLFPHLLQLINSNPHLPSIFILLMLFPLVTIYTVFNIFQCCYVCMHASCTTSAVHIYSTKLFFSPLAILFYTVFNILCIAFQCRLYACPCTTSAIHFSVHFILCFSVFLCACILCQFHSTFIYILYYYIY